MLEVAQALEKVGEAPEDFVPLIDDGTIILQVVQDSENSNKMVQKMIEDGLPLKGITAVISKLPQVAAGGDRVAGRVQNFTPTPVGIEALKTHLEKYGDLINFRLNRYPGTRVYDRTAEFVLNISASHKLPPALCRIDNVTWAEDARITIITRKKFCYFCRSTEHIRRECTEAPACYHCGNCDHAPSRCSLRGKPRKVAYNPLEDWKADDAAMSENGPQGASDSQGSPTSIHAPGEGITAEPPRRSDDSERSVDHAPPAASTTLSKLVQNATESGSPAVTKTSVPLTVSNDLICDDQTSAGANSTGFQKVARRSHRASSSTSSIRASPFERNPGDNAKRARRLSTSS